jgi:hypothetical protein
LLFKTKNFCCHFTVNKGRIKFCSDCTHSHRNREMELDPCC